jgi:hypothetical protein
MSTEINETRTDQDPEHESAERSEQNWSNDETGAVPEQSAGAPIGSELDEDERDGDDAYPGETRFGRDGSAPAYVTAEDVEGEQPFPGAESAQGVDYPNEAETGSESVRDGDAEADADEFPAFGELTSETGVPEAGQRLAADDDLPNAGVDELPPSTNLESADDLQGAVDSNDAPLLGGASPELEGVPRPENLGGHNLDVEGEPLVGADAQQEFLSRWTQIQVSFLEDPAGAVQSADALIQEIGAAILASLEERGGELASGGRAAADTEQQRLALRQYRAYIGVLLPQ